VFAQLQKYTHFFRGLSRSVATLKSTSDVASRRRLIVPRHSSTKFGRRAFSVAGPTVWNSLPDYLRDPSLSENTSRRLLKTYLLALY